MEIKKENIPEEMRDLPNWVLWRYEKRDGKKTKIPYSVTGARAKSNDPETWTSFDKAARLASQYDGVGFMLGMSPFVGIDVDHCLDTAEKRARAEQLAKDCNTYTEISPSGTGLHIIGRAELAKGFRNDVVEVYPNGRYFTVTGNSFGACLPIGNIQHVIDRLKDSIGRAKGAKSSKPDAAVADPESIIRRIRKSKQAARFVSLFDNGDTSAYDGDDSAADMALMNMLPFWTNGNEEMMERIFSLSALGQREKWKRRPDYRQRTIDKALRDWNGERYGNKWPLGVEHVGPLSENQERQLATLPATDTGNAERLKVVFGDRLKYLPEKGRGAAWMKWNGKKWASAYESELYNMVSTVAAMSFKAADTYLKADLENPDSIKAKKAIMNFLARTGNQKQIDSCLKRARGLFGASITDFDKDKYLLNVQNGVVDLETGMLLPHDKARMCSKICRAEFHPELMGRPSLWEQTLAAIVPDAEERDYLQKWAGYLLIGSAPEEKLLFLYGEGGSGKGTFINTLGYMMGDYADTVDIEIFLSSRNDGHSGGAAASPEIAKLAGVRAAIASESGLGRKLNDAKVKNMTGRDDLTARYLYGQQFTFSPVVKFVLQSNYLPAVLDANDTGIRRRLVIAPFMENLDRLRDPMLKERLKEPENLAAVLAWCVVGCMAWMQDGGLGEPPDRFKRQAARFYEDSDTLQQFIDEECTTGGPGSVARVRVKEFCDRYRDWLREPIKRKTITALMKRKGYIPHKYGDWGQCFDGLEMNNRDIFSIT